MSVLTPDSREAPTGAPRDRAPANSQPATSSLARTRLSAAERRVQLIKIAQPLFAERGYHHISMEDVAAAAQVTKPVLYKHFPSKMDLYLALLDDRGGALIDTVTRALDIATSTAGAPTDLGQRIVHTVINAYVDFVHSCGVAAMLLFDSDVTRDEQMRARVEAPNAHVAHIVAQTLMSLTSLPDSAALEVARASVAMAKHAAADTLDPDPLDILTPAQRVELIAQFTWRGVGGVLKQHGAGELP